MRAAQIVDGVVVNFIEVDEFTEDWIDPTGAVLGSTWDGEVFTDPPPAPPPAPLPRHITKLAFDNRFTQEELVTLELASIDDPAGTTEQRTLAANLRVYQRKVDRATYIDLDRADTRAGVIALEQFAILADGRAIEILDGEITDIERVPS